MSFRKTAVLHLLLGGLAALALAAAMIMFGLKLAEIGAGPDLSWGLIFGTGAGALGLGVLDLFVIFKAME